MKEGMELKGNVSIVLRDSEGRFKARRVIHNTVPANGLAHVADRLSTTPGQAAMGWMAVGTGTPSATLLGTEVDRNALTSCTDSGAVVTYVADWAAGDATATITEAGVFNVVTANTITMLMSASFAGIAKGANDTLSITWTLTLS